MLDRSFEREYASLDDASPALMSFSRPRYSLK